MLVRRNIPSRNCRKSPGIRVRYYFTGAAQFEHLRLPGALGMLHDSPAAPIPLVDEIVGLVAGQPLLHQEADGLSLQHLLAAAGCGS